MNKFYRIISYIIIALLFFIILFPKDRLFYLLLDDLKDKKVIFTNVNLQNNLFSLKINNSNILYDGIKAVKIDSIALKTYILSNNILIKNIYINDVFKEFLPPRINNIDISYNILNPLKIDISIYSKLFKGVGYFSILSNKITLKIKFSELFKRKYSNMLQQFRYDKTTKDYIYEYKL